MHWSSLGTCFLHWMQKVTLYNVYLPYTRLLYHTLFCWAPRHTMQTMVLPHPSSTIWNKHKLGRHLYAPWGWDRQAASHQPHVRQMHGTSKQPLVSPLSTRCMFLEEFKGSLSWCHSGLESCSKQHVGPSDLCLSRSCFCSELHSQAVVVVAVAVGLYAQTNVAQCLLKLQLCWATPMRYTRIRKLPNGCNEMHDKGTLIMHADQVVVMYVQGWTAIPCMVSVVNARHGDSACQYLVVATY